ncbi:PH domain-containing protein [Candidatus Peregrinibacteria bacterium]|nr:PH domain-containing protein [Candidatus Peregrinibacteria bacterium]
MHLSEGEQILKVYHHHPTPFVFTLIKIIIGTIPFFLLMYLFKKSLPVKWYIVGHLIIFLIFSLVIIYAALVYWLDKLVVTNLRIVFIDWKFLTIRDETEAFLDDIEDIRTQERGMLSSLKILDYGMFEVETAASTITIKFTDAPDPEEIRNYIYHVKKQ